MAESPPSSSSSRAPKKRLGEIALEKGQITEQQLGEAISTQQSIKRLGLDERLGEILVRRKHLTPNALEALLEIQNQVAKSCRLGNFEIYEKIGQGAMGIVFRARQRSMDRIVALKVLAPVYAKDKSFIKRFIREAHVARQLNHPNIVNAIDVGKAGSYYYLAMEYVDGEELAKVLRKRGVLAENEALNYTRHIAEALHHAHARKLIHRDVKPANIMISREGVAKLLDMGLVCALDAGDRPEAEDDHSDERGKETTRKAIGTPYYISPEGARGDEDLDTRADIYSLGCTLYHLLTGKAPFEGSDAKAVMLKHVTDPVPDVRDARPLITKETAALVAKMTAKKCEDRFENPMRLIEAIREIQGGSKTAGPQEQRIGGSLRKRDGP